MTTADLVLYDRTIKYSIKTSDRAQRLRLAVYANGNVMVTKPASISESDVIKYVEFKKEWIERKLKFSYALPIPELRITSHRHFLTHKDRAQHLVEAIAERWKRKLKVKYQRVVVKKFKTIWGSCSSKRNLSFNYKIMFLPSNLQDYLVVHELCHLKEMNHSPKFWKWVASVLPHYSELKKTIKYL